MSDAPNRSRGAWRTRVGLEQTSRRERTSTLVAARAAARAAYTTERIRSSPIAQTAMPPCKCLTSGSMIFRYLAEQSFLFALFRSGFPDLPRFFSHTITSPSLLPALVSFSCSGPSSGNYLVSFVLCWSSSRHTTNFLWSIATALLPDGRST